jgi:ATP-binding cassette, subfamily B, multidrug efflux pump
MIGRIEEARNPRNALLRLLPYLRPFRKRLAMVFGCVVIYTLLGLLGPYLMGRAIDLFISTGLPSGLPGIAALMLAAYLGSNLFQAFAGWLMASISQESLKLLRGDLFGHLQTIPIGFFDRKPAGELMSRLTNDIDAVNSAVSQNVTTLLASTLSMAGILVAMFVMNVWLALAALFVVPVMLWFTGFVARYTRRGFRDLQKHLGHLNAVAEETIGGQKVVMAFRRNQTVLDDFRRSNEGVFRAGVYANSYALLLMPVSNALGNIFVVVLAGVGGWLALRGMVTVGTIAAFIAYGRNFIQPLRQIANMYNSIQAALAGAERVFEIIDSPSEADEAAGAELPAGVPGRVEFEKVDFEYEPGTPVIRDLSMVAEAGKTIALVGPTGAGKTTIINLLTRFYETSSGRIGIDGMDIRAVGKADLRRSLGLVLQDTFMFADTVMENIRFGRLDATDEECVAAAKLAEADHFIRQLPQGYSTDLTERAGNLSQGQRQLLSITRAILANPRILILDEATSSVDTRTEIRIQKALLRLMERRTSFVIAHRLSTIRDADQVVVIDRGRIVERGTHESLLDRRGFYHDLYVAQFKGQAI